MCQRDTAAGCGHNSNLQHAAASERLTSSSSTSTRANTAAGNRPLSSSKKGAISAQGLHQVAQKSTTNYRCQASDTKKDTKTSTRDNMA